MERYVVVGRERLPADTGEERSTVQVLLAKGRPFPRIALVWLDIGGMASAVDVIVVGAKLVGLELSI